MLGKPSIWMPLRSSFPLPTVLMAYWGVIFCTSKQGAANDQLHAGCWSVAVVLAVWVLLISGPDLTKQLLLLQQTPRENWSCLPVRLHAETRARLCRTRDMRSARLGEVWLAAVTGLGAGAFLCF